MAFRMVESTIRIMGEIRERRVDGIAFAGVVNSGDAASVILNSQHRSSQFLSSIPPQARSTNPSFLPQTHFSYPSSAPFLAHLESVLRGLEESSLQGSPQAVSTPFAPPGKTREDISHPARYADTSPTPQPSRRLPPPELSGSEISAVSSYRDQIRHHLRARAKGELQLFNLCCAAAKHMMIDHTSSKHLFISHRISLFLLERIGSILLPEARNCK